jgi:hypothetical protein
MKSFTCILALLWATTTASASLIVDQQNLSSIGTATNNLKAGQSFIPTASNLAAVDFGFSSGGFNATSVDILDGLIGTRGLDGTVLATSDSVTGLGGGFFRFEFSTPVALTPGNTYVAVVNKSGSAGVRIATNNPYAFGQRTEDQATLGLFANHDMVFTTYSLVPEPAAAAVWGLMGGLALVTRRRRSLNRAGKGRA